MHAKLRHLLLLILPPIVVAGMGRLRRSLRSRTAEAPSSSLSAESAAAESSAPEWEMVPDTAQVWSDLPGWSHTSIVQTQRAKWSDFLRSVEGTRPFGQSHEASPAAAQNLAAHNTIITFGYALARAAVGHESLSVLDWGGGLGHYYVYARALLPELPLDFTVKDFPGLCAAGAKLLPEVTFVSDEAQALSRRYDVVFASSSLHYTRDHYGLLARLCDSATEWLMITRTPIVEQSEEFVVVQRPHMYGYMTEYPGWFMNRARLVAFMRERNFGLDRQFLVGEQPNVGNAPEQAQYYGFLFRRRQSNEGAC